MNNPDAMEILRDDLKMGSFQRARSNLNKKVKDLKTGKILEIIEVKSSYGTPYYRMADSKGAIDEIAVDNFGKYYELLRGKH